MAQVRGDVTGQEGVLVRTPARCVYGDVFGSTACECAWRLVRQPPKRIAEEGRGVLVYLHETGPGFRVQANSSSINRMVSRDRDFMHLKFAQIRKLAHDSGALLLQILQGKRHEVPPESNVYDTHGLPAKIRSPANAHFHVAHPNGQIQYTPPKPLAPTGAATVLRQSGKRGRLTPQDLLGPGRRPSRGHQHRTTRPVCRGLGLATVPNTPPARAPSRRLP
jgi:GTP cyclohydrolase II